MALLVKLILIHELFLKIWSSDIFIPKFESRTFFVFLELWERGITLSWPEDYIKGRFVRPLKRQFALLSITSYFLSGF